MFSLKEKQEIAEMVEKIILNIKHPEMPKEKPLFKLRIEGKESWSWAEIMPNWTYTDKNPPTITNWNENARKYLKDK